MSDCVVKVANNLWVGDVRAATNLAATGSEIGAMLSVIQEGFAIDMAAMIYMRLPVPDGEGFEYHHLKAGVEFLEYVHGKQELPTLVHCYAGLSRSVTVAATYMVQHGIPAPGSAPMALTEIDWVMSSIVELRGYDSDKFPVEHLRKLAREATDHVPLCRELKALTDDLREKKFPRPDSPPGQYVCPNAEERAALSIPEGADAAIWVGPEPMIESQAEADKYADARWQQELAKRLRNDPRLTDLKKAEK